MANPKIRPAVAADAEALSHLILENAHELLMPYYNEEQWIAFSKFYSPDEMQKKIAEQRIFCAEVDEQIAGTIALDKNLLVGFYTNIHFLNKGIGKMLMEYIETLTVKEGITELELTASPLAVTFYDKMGWTRIKVNTYYYFGVGFEETLMIKNLI